MPIRPVVEIVVEHPFFASGAFAEARVEPDAATAARLRGLRLVAKRQAGQLALLAEIDAGGAPRVPVPATRLRFELRPLPADLAQATDLAPLRPGATFNDEGAATGPLRLVIRETTGRETLDKPPGAATIVLAGRPRPGATATDFAVVPAGIRATGYDPAGNLISVDGPAGRFAVDYPVAPPRSGALAAIEIGIGPETLAQAAAGAPRRCVVALQPAAARWCYHLVTNLPNPLADWRIAQVNGAGDRPAVSFSDAGRAEIAAGTSGDPFGTELWRRSTPLRVLRFVSDAPVPCSERVARRIALFAGATQLFAALPNPSPAQPRQIGGEAAFGEVLRLMTV